MPIESNEPAEEIILSVSGVEGQRAQSHHADRRVSGLRGIPTYITSYNNARSLIRRLERDEILEELVRFYISQEHETA